MKILLTGCAGFIGYHLSKKLLKNNNYVLGIDNLDPYYDLKLKNHRIKDLKKNKKFEYYKFDLNNKKKLKTIFENNKIKIVIHLAAQAGVRYSIIKPENYLKSNIDAFFNILDYSRLFKVKHFMYASSSSVYGSAKNFPTNENEKTDLPLSFYAATKKSNEIFAHAYSNIYKLPTTGLRFFTVYGPLGRPDMSIFKFVKANFSKNKIDLFNGGNHNRDFTYIDDAVDGVVSLINKPNKHKVPFQVLNISGGSSYKLSEVLNNIKSINKISFLIKKLPMQQGDVIKTQADIKLIKRLTGFKPKFNLKTGIEKFINWYKEYYRHSK
jgi:UDP-glucuronate 4-epimerase